jgi:hypothetical protein
MTPTDDPFDTRPTADQLATDALLDRLGARAPTPDDLDDPLVAALALMAAEIDLDAVPAENTRTALARALPEAAPTAHQAPDVPPHDEQTGLVLDLRDDARPSRPALRAVGGRAAEARGRRRPARGREPVRAPTTAMAPPRSLARVPSSHGPGGSRGPQDRRERRLRPMVAVAVALVAIVAGSGLSAAVTGGRSVNPLDGIQYVVAEVTGGRTDEQAAALADANTALDRAAEHVRAQEYDKARAELAKATKLRPRLTTDDREAVDERIATIRSGLRR